MPRIHDFGSFSIHIYFEDHNPPHFHVVGPDFHAGVTIEDPSIIGGDLPHGVLRRVRRWALANRALLDRFWAQYR